MTSALAVDHPADVSAALAEAVRRAGRIAPGAAPDLAAASVRSRPALPVDPAFAPVLPQGLRRGTSIGIAGGIASTSLTLALVGAAGAAGSWCALVGLPPLTAEAVAGFGLDLGRVAVVPASSLVRGASATAGWTTAVGALVDAVDLVVVRPPGRLPDGDVRRLTARARSRGAVLLVVTPGGAGWPGLDVRLTADHVAWAGHEGASGPRGHGRLRARQVELRSHGRGAPLPALPLWLPGPSGGVEPVVAVPTPLRRVG